MEHVPISQNRRSQRSNVLLSAIVECTQGDLSVRLRNLSANGALIEARTLPVEGEQILFRRNDIRVSARIAWVMGNHAGVAFEQRLDPELVLRNVPAIKPRAKPSFRRPGVNGTSLTRDEQQFIERWLRERG